VDSLPVHPFPVTMNRVRSQSGQATVELGATIAWLLIAALIAWQLALAGWTYVGASNTARTVARLFSREQNESHATSEGMHSLSSDGLGNGASVQYDSQTSTWIVKAKVPIVVPDLAGPTITQEATMPNTG